ncbi:beta-glucosidase [Histoplasma capsulatum G186AR]|uniref:Beta-glucosidase n=1 Tax=Ajellomyces capsulatus (strain G186AR / H82 / ATCC MYA-2454 / RMSCC 2432) TaxID=447093 RepID=C0NEZ3_AJECG|nr:beta-glucosidase [Histoplasma capsulatum G186AR]EEH09814.1 beta-glucosidase [Histoplasma capsulatum G186AR]
MNSMTSKLHFDFLWSRTIPLGGKGNDTINENGLQHYVKFVNDLLAAGITLSNDNIVTLGSPHSILGYNTGLFAPGCYRDRSKSVGLDSSRDPWIVGHNLLVAHGVAVKIYREEFKTIGGGGEIGITLNDPIYFCEHPDSILRQLGNPLPAWTEEDRALVQSSNDSYCMNHYCVHFIKNKAGESDPDDFHGDIETLMEGRNESEVRSEIQSEWLCPCPLGFRKLLKWLSDRYGRPKI